jgi:hypothetical protein
VGIELTDLGSAVRITANTTNLSLFGCQVEKQQTLPMESKVQVRIAHRGETFTALGRVTRIQFDGETGTVFTGMESTDQMILDKWLGESRTNGRR